MADVAVRAGRHDGVAAVGLNTDGRFREAVHGHGPRDQGHAKEKEERAGIRRPEGHGRPAEPHGIQSRHRRLKGAEGEEYPQNDFVERLGIRTAPLRARFH